jgi:alcohol dehydrogenase (cytochrome c)
MSAPLPTLQAEQSDTTKQGGDVMGSQHFRSFALALGAAVIATPVLAAEVTPERLVKADHEPQNWLMNHRTYDGQRFSPLARINKDNVKNLRLAYAVTLGGGTGDEWTEATPLVEDGFLYITDAWGVLYKIDGRSGDAGHIVWRMDPKQEKQENNRGAAFWGNLVISPANLPARLVATDKETGKMVWETNMMFDQSATRITAAPLVIKDKIVIGASGGDAGVRDWLAGLDAATGKVLWRKFIVPAPGEPGSETWKDHNNAWQTGGGAIWVTGTYDPDTNQTIWGTGNPVPMFDPNYRPGDNLYTNSAISWDPDSGKMDWYFQYTPGDMWDFDAVGTQILIDGDIAGQKRKLVTHSARNGFLYTIDRSNGQIVGAKPYVQVTWTKGIDQKTGKPIDYDSGKDVQTYAGVGNLTPGAPLKSVCPSYNGGNNFFPSSYSARTKLIYTPAYTTCSTVAVDPNKHSAATGGFSGGFVKPERFESALVAIDPVTQEIKKSIALPYPNAAGTLSTAGGLVFTALLDGTVAAYDDTTLAQLWKMNLGTYFKAPPITFEVNGRQYLAITSGGGVSARRRLSNTPELKDEGNAVVLYVFAL